MTDRFEGYDDMFEGRHLHKSAVRAVIGFIWEATPFTFFGELI